MKHYRLTLWLGLLLLSQHSSVIAHHYQVEQVADGIFYHQGIHEDASPENLGAIANVGFIVGDDCVAVIDSGGSYAEGELLKHALGKHTIKPVCYVINTHVHPDHMLGNAAFKMEHPIYIGHAKLPDAVTARQAFYDRAFSEALGSAYKGTEFIIPDKIVNPGSPITIDLGNRQLLISAYSTAHTDHDLTVLDQKTKTLWTGDLLFMDRIPAIDGSINGWISNIDNLSSLDVVYVIPGHGPASSDKWQAGWEKQRHYLVTIRDQIRELIADFGTINEAIERIGQEEKDQWLLFEAYHRRNVTAAFVELEWE